MQTNVAVSGNAISGTLNYVTGYTGFSSVEAKQAGNYLALKVNTNRTGGTTTVEVMGGEDDPITLDSDMNVVVYLTDTETQRIKVVNTEGSDSVTKIYNLTGLTLGESE